MAVRFWIAPMLVAQTGCLHIQQPPIARAAAYLWQQQADDGGWHSHTYGLLRSGQSLTPFVLEALLEVPERLYPLPKGKVDRAIAFIKNHTRQDGALGMNDPGVPDYPNYATALAVNALCRIRRAGWKEQIGPMVAYLRVQQFTEQNGWDHLDPAYGGWGMGGERRTKPNTGHVDLSMTRHVLQALRAAGASDSDPAFEARACSRSAARTSIRSARMMVTAASSSQPLSLRLIRRATTVRISEAMALRRRMAFWRCSRLAGHPATRGWHRPNIGWRAITMTLTFQVSRGRHTSAGPAVWLSITQPPAARCLARSTSMQAGTWQTVCGGLNAPTAPGRTRKTWSRKMIR